MAKPQPIFTENRIKFRKKMKHGTIYRRVSEFSAEKEIIEAGLKNYFHTR